MLMSMRLIQVVEVLNFVTEGISFPWALKCRPSKKNWPQIVVLKDSSLDGFEKVSVDSIVIFALDL